MILCLSLVLVRTLNYNKGFQQIQGLFFRQKSHNIKGLEGVRPPKKKMTLFLYVSR